MKDRSARRGFCSYTPTNINKMSEGHLLHDAKCLQHAVGEKKIVFFRLILCDGSAICQLMPDKAE